MDKKHMTTLVDCLKNLVNEGFKENFKIEKKGLWSGEGKKFYDPSQIRIVNFYRFEGESDPADSSILYAIKTNDGRKGTLLNAYGPYSDTAITEFISHVEEITKTHHQ